LLHTEQQRPAFAAAFLDSSAGAITLIVLQLLMKTKTLPALGQTLLTCCLLSGLPMVASGNPTTLITD
jgi:hypothetical protein